LVYLGRGDGQVKINGFRVELGEIESAISDFPSVQQVSVIAHTDSAGRQRLAAYFVAAGDTPIPTHSMSEFLSRRLPAQMMPAFYMQIDKMPLTGNGKIDRAALPQPTAGSLKSEWSAGSPMQQRVAAIWCKVLGTRNVTMDDNFFDIGGSSVLLVSVRAALQEQLARSIPVTWMFEYTTIRSLAERLTNTDTAAAGANASTDSAQIGAAQDQARKQRDAFARLRAARGAAR
jgi:acyl carrier protein